MIHVFDNSVIGGFPQARRGTAGFANFSRKVFGRADGGERIGHARFAEQHL